MIHKQILDEAGDWFVMMRDGGGDAAVRAEFADWLRKSPEHVRAYLELTSIWAEVAGVDAERTLNAQTLIARARGKGNVVAFGEIRVLHQASGVEQNRSAASEFAKQQLSSEAGTDARSLEARSVVDPGNELSIVQLRNKTSVRKSSTRMSQHRHLFAASVAVAAMAGGAWWQMSRPLVYATGIGEQRSITLTDGSRVELNARSRLRIRFSESERFVDLLEGQGMFQVSRDPERPFIVRSSDTHVRAVGTQFDVYRKPSGTVVTVLEGKVEVRTTASPSFSLSEDSSAEPRASTPPVAGEGRTEKGESQRSLRRAVTELTAGEQVIIAADQIIRPPTVNITAATAWTHRRLVFDSASLAEVAHEFNRHNQRQLVIRDPRLESFLISGVFSSTNPSSLLRFLEQQPNFSIEETETEIRISRRE